MPIEKLGEVLEKTGIPVAYRFFREGEAPPLPFLVYYEAAENTLPADGGNYYQIPQVVVELYTKEKEFKTEAAVEQALFFTVWDKAENYLDQEECYQIVYTMEV